MYGCGFDYKKQNRTKFIAFVVYFFIEMYLVKESVQIFPDRSQLGGTVAESIGLPDYCSVYQAEVLTIQTTVTIIWGNTNIPCDGQDIMKPLFGSRVTMISRATAERINWPDVPFTI